MSVCTIVACAGNQWGAFSEIIPYKTAEGKSNNCVVSVQFFSEVELCLNANFASFITLILGKRLCHCWCFDLCLLSLLCLSIHCHWHEIPKYLWCYSKSPSVTASSPLLHTASFIFWHFMLSFITVSLCAAMSLSSVVESWNQKSL